MALMNSASVKPLATFADAMRMLVKYLPSKRGHFVYGLENMQRFMELIGNPQDKLKVIHVAGTSGKTSTAYYISALLTETGYNVGLMVSPHIRELNERVQINNVPLNEKEFCKGLTEFMKLVLDSKIPLSYSEILYAFAYWEFATRHVDFAVIEAGMGGTLDATNVISREDKVCVITDVGLDHQRRLGRHVHEIAAHKAGIIQLKNTVFCYRQSEEILGQIQFRASLVQADLHLLEGVNVSEALGHLPLFQQRNICLALAAVRYVLKRENTSLVPENILAAAKIQVPGRMEILHVGGKIVILDGAHNPQKMRALVESVRHKFPGQRVAVMLALVEKDDIERIEKITAEIAPLANHIIATSFGDNGFHASTDAHLVAAHCKTHGHYNTETVDDLAKAIPRLLHRSEPILLITGSLYLMHQAKKTLDAIG